MRRPAACAPSWPRATPSPSSWPGPTRSTGSWSCRSPPTGRPTTSASRPATWSPTSPPGPGQSSAGRCGRCRPRWPGPSGGVRSSIPSPGASVRGVRTHGTAGFGRHEWYGATRPAPDRRSPDHPRRRRPGRPRRRVAARSLRVRICAPAAERRGRHHDRPGGGVDGRGVTSGAVHSSDGVIGVAVVRLSVLRCRRRRPPGGGRRGRSSPALAPRAARPARAATGAGRSGRVRPGYRPRGAARRADAFPPAGRRPPCGPRTRPTPRR
jgi:hypothetical protein